MTLCAYCHMEEYGHLSYTIPAVRMCSKPPPRRKWRSCRPLFRELTICGRRHMVMDEPSRSGRNGILCAGAKRVVRGVSECEASREGLYSAEAKGDLRLDQRTDHDARPGLGGPHVTPSRNSTASGGGNLAIEKWSDHHHSEPKSVTRFPRTIHSQLGWPHTHCLRHAFTVGRIGLHTVPDMSELDFLGRIAHRASGVLEEHLLLLGRHQPEEKPRL